MPVKPPDDFAQAELSLAIVPAGRRYGRIYLSRFPDPLGFGKSPSRFSDPRRRKPENRFGVIYLGESLKVCFLEAVLRDQHDGHFGDLPLAETELQMRSYATIMTQTDLRLVDLREDAAIRMGVPTDVARSSRQSLARKWSLAFHEHPARVDGVIYPSRLNAETNIAVYDRSIGKLGHIETSPLVRARGLAGVLNDLQLALV